MERRTLTRAVVASSMAAVLVGAAGVAFAQAEPAPAGYEPPPGVPISASPEHVASEREAKARPWLLWAEPRLVVSLGRGGTELPPVGWGAAVGMSRALFTRGRARLGLGASFAYERLQHTKVPPPDLENGDTIEWLSHASFSVDLRLDGFFLAGVLRPWVSLGPGLSVSSYNDPPSKDSPMGIHETKILPALRAAVGLAGRVAEGVELGGHVEWLATFLVPTFGNPPVSPMGPGTFSVGVDVGFRF